MLARQFGSPPGVCVGTVSGQWGATGCEGLGGNQCRIWGQWCQWETFAFQGITRELSLGDGANVEVAEVLPGIFVGTSCDKSNLTFVRDRDGTMIVFDAGQRVDGTRAIVVVPQKSAVVD
jgi:hypothetical protein